MPTFAVERLSEISHELEISQLRVDGVGAMDEFIKKFAVGNTRKDVIRITSTMEQVSKRLSMPYTKWHPLKGSAGTVREYEAKAGDLRLYAVQIHPGYIIVLGGTKGNQDRDIRRLRSLKDSYLKALRR